METNQSNDVEIFVTVEMAKAGGKYLTESGQMLNGSMGQEYLAVQVFRHMLAARPRAISELVTRSNLDVPEEDP